MDPEDRREFGDYIEECKRAGKRDQGRTEISLTTSCARKSQSFEGSDGKPPD
jgi:hypothetical protein